VWANPPARPCAGRHLAPRTRSENLLVRRRRPESVYAVAAASGSHKLLLCPHDDHSALWTSPSARSVALDRAPFPQEDISDRTRDEALPASIGWMVAGFIVFRFLDIAKPWPIGLADRRLRGGLGIMVDDALAGVAGCAVLHAIAYLIA